MPNSNEYWKKRMEMLQEAQLHKGEQYLIDLEKQYREATKTIEREIAVWNQRFADNNEISMFEAKKLLSTKELKEFKWDVKEYIKYGEQNALDQSWMKELENASARVHVSRLESLRLKLQHQVEVLYGNQVDGLDNLLRDIYQDGYYHTAFEIQQGFNIGWDLHALDKVQMDKILSRPWSLDKKTFSDRLWSNKQLLIGNLQTYLTQAVITGKSPDEVIRTLTKEFGTDKNKAGRLVMTESAAFASMSQKDAFTMLDVERFEIVATLDRRTSEICQDLDGHVFDMKDFEVGATAPPFHPWCRTTTVPFFEDNYTERAAKDFEGKTYYVPSDMKYHDWYKKHIVDQFGEEQANFLEKSFKNIKSDKFQYKKYKAIFGDQIPDSFEDFQDLKYNRIEEWENLKTKKQEVLNAKDYKNSFDGLLGDKEVREWYITHDKNIINLINESASIKEQAVQAHNLRNRYRSQARLMMSNRPKAEELNLNNPNRTFDELVQDKMDRKGLTKEQAYQDIISTAGKTNKKVNERFNLE